VTTIVVAVIAAWLLLILARMCGNIAASLRYTAVLHHKPIDEIQEVRLRRGL
jgi:hypothetical protein